MEHQKLWIRWRRIIDVWDQSAWKIISCAFPENSNGSRMMVTTRLDDVAVMTCDRYHSRVYRMKHLKEQDSRRLFFNKVFGSKNACPPQFQDILAQILKKCRGFPLAFITTSHQQMMTSLRLIQLLHLQPHFLTFHNSKDLSQELMHAN
jgi:hypothetical protein